MSSKNKVYNITEISKRDLEFLSSTPSFRLYALKDGIYIGDYKITHKMLRNDISVFSKKEMKIFFESFLTSKQLPLMRHVYDYFNYFYDTDAVVDERLLLNSKTEKFKKKYVHQASLIINKYHYRLFGKNYLGQLYKLLCEYYGGQHINKEWIFSPTYLPLNYEGNYPLISKMILLRDQKRKVLKLLQKNEHDRLNHLSPFIIYFTQDIPSIRRILGKKTWKMMCTHSVTRNRYIVALWEKLKIKFSTSNKSKRLNLETMRLIGFIRSTSLIKLVNESRYLNRFNSESELLIFLNYYAYHQLTPKVMDQAFLIITDTIELSIRLETRFNKKWSLRRINEEHDKLVRAQNKQSLQNIENVTLNTDFPRNKTIEINNTKVSIINTAHDLFYEGQVMSHCVYGYKNSLEKKAYLVFHLEDSIQNQSTLMLDNSDYSIIQHYGKYNKLVTSKHLLHVADSLKDFKNTMFL